MHVTASTPAITDQASSRLPRAGASQLTSSSGSTVPPIAASSLTAVRYDTSRVRSL